MGGDSVYFSGLAEGFVNSQFGWVGACDGIDGDLCEPRASDATGWEIHSVAMTILENNSTPPLISIGMPVYNGARFIGVALQSLLDQSYQNFELIVSDN